jgi:hypothetical protein
VSKWKCGRERERESEDESEHSVTITCLHLHLDHLAVVVKQAFGVSVCVLSE